MRSQRLIQIHISRFCRSSSEAQKVASIRPNTSFLRFRFYEFRSKFHGLLNRKNKFPVDGLMVMLLVPLSVEIV